MPPVRLTPKLRDEYQNLFDTCVIRPERQTEIEKLANAILKNKTRYEAVAGPLNAPWFFVGAVHCMEASLDFNTHLHNGDSLKKQTVQVPAGRPKGSAGPFTWEVSADDALRLKKIEQIADWSVPSLLFQLERYNGFGYRNRPEPIPTPYLWSYANHYSKGKFIADGKYSPTAVSKQAGCAVILRRLAERGDIAFADTPAPDAGALPQVVFAPSTFSAEAKLLQEALNKFPGIFVKPDGFAGEKTSDAFRKVTGHFLHGDPRG
jgi:lysozyme family protein